MGTQSPDPDAPPLWHSQEKDVGTLEVGGHRTDPPESIITRLARNTCRASSLRGLWSDI
jgi:hypothetical protein